MSNFQGVASQKLAQNGDFACFLLARIDLTGTVLTVNGGASMHHIVDQKMPPSVASWSKLFVDLSISILKIKWLGIFQERLTKHPL